MNILANILIATFGVSAISLLGGIFFISKKTIHKQFLSYVVSFAAGVMLTNAILGLLPEAFEEADGSNIFLPLLLGIVVFFFLERFLLWFHHHDDDHDAKPSTTLILFGDIFHNTFDGIAIAAAFIAHPTAGFVTALAIAAHEIPQEIADMGILIHNGMDKTRALFLNFITALTAILGGVIGFFFLEKIEGILPLFLAFTSGTFIYIACSDLIPELHQDYKKNKKWQQSIPFILGIIAIYFITNYLHGAH